MDYASFGVGDSVQITFPSSIPITGTSIIPSYGPYQYSEVTGNANGQTVTITLTKVGKQIENQIRLSVYMATNPSTYQS